MTVAIKSSADGLSGTILTNDNPAIKFDKSGITQGAPFSFRNKIINGAMLIDQRNGGAAITPTASAAFGADRMVYYFTQASKITLQTVVDAPAGFKNSLKVSVASSYTPVAGDVFCFGQNIEGVNISEFNYGTANAKTVTVSFWAKSSILSEYSIFLQNNANDMNYVTSFTLAANTWTKITKTIPGPTSGTWANDNSRGVCVLIGLGGGPNRINTTPDAWTTITANNKFMTASNTQFISQPNGTSLQITGLQLECGEIATPFEHRPYGLEFSMCQRYFEKQAVRSVTANTGVTVYCYWKFSTEKRVGPTLSVGSGSQWTSVDSLGTDGMLVYMSSGTCVIQNCTVSAEI